MPRIPADDDRSTAPNGGLHFLPWVPRDFRATTQLWPLVPKAAYRELLDLQWEVGGLPDDEQVLRGCVGASPKEWKLAWSFLAQKFPVCDDGLRRNPRLERHRQDALERRQRFQARSEKGNRARWNRSSSNAQSTPSRNPSRNAQAILQGVQQGRFKDSTQEQEQEKRRTLRRGESLPPNASSAASSPAGARQKK